MLKRLKNIYRLAVGLARKRFMPSDVIGNPLAKAGDESQDVTECKKDKEIQKNVRQFKKQTKRMERVAMVAHRPGCDILTCDRKMCSTGAMFKIASRPKKVKRKSGKYVEVDK